MHCNYLHVAEETIFFFFESRNWFRSFFFIEFDSGLEMVVFYIYTPCLYPTTFEGSTVGFQTCLGSIAQNSPLIPSKLHWNRSMFSGAMSKSTRPLFAYNKTILSVISLQLFQLKCKHSNNVTVLNVHIRTVYTR